VAKVDPLPFSGHSLRAGFVTSALEDGADLFKVMDVTRHREVKTLKAYDRRQGVQGSRGERIPVSDTELRVLALAAAIECQGPKAVTGEVLDAAEEFYRFLKGLEDAGETAH
jgi:hypothetical protein